MLKLPESTKLNKQLPKKAIYAKFKLKPTVREKFDADISKISIINEVSATTAAIAKGNNVESFFVLLILLKHDRFDEKNIVLLSKLIEQQMLFVLQCSEQAKLAVFQGKLYQTDWMPADDLQIELQGSNLDTIWENIVVQISGIEIEQGNTLDAQLRISEDQQKLEKQIETLERKARAENQPRRKFEIVQEIKKLKTLKNKQ